MKKAIPVLFILLINIATNSYAQSLHTISDSAAVARYIRPSDIISEDIRWDRASSDLFTYLVSNELYGFYGPQPEIFIDGLPVDANYFGWQNLNMLPLANLREIKYSLDPQVYKNNISRAGFIDFKSTTIDSGLSVNASFYVGNETGDPGPYNYDSSKVTPNIDRWGPDGSLSMAYRKNNWYARGILTSRKYTPTDLTSNARLHFTSSLLGTNKRYVNHRIYTTSRAALLKSGYKTSNLQIKARAILGLSKDYLFLQPFGREVPVKTGYRQIALSSIYHTKNWKLSGSYIEQKKSIDKRINLHSYIFNWNQHKHAVNFSAAYTSSFFKLKPGFTFSTFTTDAPGLSDNANRAATFFSDASLATNATDSLNIQASIDYNDKKVAKTLGINFRKKIINSWKLVPSLTFTEVLPLNQDSFSYWVNRGYTFAHALGIPYSDSVSVRKNQLTILKLKNNIRIAPHLLLTIEPTVVIHKLLNVPYQPVKAEEYTTDTKPGRLMVTQEHGSRLTFYSKISFPLNKVLTQSLSVNIQRSLAGTQRYKEYFSQIPDTKVNYAIDIYPKSNLILSLKALYRSSTTWKEFDAIEGNHYRLPNGIPIRDVSGTFHSKTPAFMDVTLCVKKWFWNRHLSTQFSIRNLLDEEIRMHPLGDELATKFDIKLSVSF